MPTFTPPTAPDQPMGYTSESSPSYKLFKFYPQVEAGMTVWKDENDVWHSQLYPYAGGEISRTYDDAADPKYTASAPASGLATAKVVYLGGHVYEITEDEATELIAAGFGAGVS